MYGPFHDRSTARTHHADGLTQPFGGAGRIDNDVVSGPGMVLSVTRFGAAAVCNRQLALPGGRRH